jgi:hypothetical protein
LGAFGAAATTLVAAVVSSASCGAPHHPPAASDETLAPGDLGTIVVATKPAPTCNLGPNGGVCDCIDQALLGDAPNLYFVLDRSLSMAEHNKWSTVIRVLGQLAVDLGPRVKIGVAVFPHPRTDHPECGPGVEVFPPTQGDAPAGWLGPTAVALLSTLGHLSPAGATPTAVTLTALQPQLQALPGKTYVVLATDGGPNCNANATCAVDQCQPNIEGIAGCTPVGRNCCTGTNNVACNDGEPTKNAVAAIAAGGISVYVVGVPGSAPYAQLLNELAQAGGTARAPDAGVGTPQYYDVNGTDQTAFEAVLRNVAAKVTGSCTMQLNAAPTDPNLVNVFLNETLLAQDGNWTLSGQTVTILDPACQSILSGNVLDVRVVAGCPTVRAR